MNFSLTDANFITGVSISTLRKRIEEGSLDAVQPNGGKWCISAIELINYAWWEWDNQRCLMRPPQTWSDRMEYIERKKGVKR